MEFLVINTDFIRDPCDEDVVNENVRNEDIDNLVLVDEVGDDQILVHPDDIYYEACLELEAALSKFRRPQLFIQVPTMCSVRRYLWTLEVGHLFPKLRDRNRLTVNCKSSERLDPRMSRIG